jgi:Asp-tRNA(Asn)/Glu-tRNA(Gln) amidotransferase A subunit family amidase
MHVPAITVPVFTGPNGLPIGAQLIAPRYADRRLLCMAQWVEQSLT